MNNWQRYQTGFKLEHGEKLRDIYVLDTNLDAWQQILDLLHSSSYTIIYEVNGERLTLPENVNAVLKNQNDSLPVLSIDIGQIVVYCYFWLNELDDDIEFNFDTSQIDNEIQLEKLFAFMRQLGDFLNKEIILTGDNCKEFPDFRFSPGDRAVQHVSE